MHLSKRFVRDFIALAILLSASATSLAAKTPPCPEPDYSVLDAVVTAELKDKHTPGAVIAVISEDKVVYARACGVANIETNASMEKEMLFRIGWFSELYSAKRVEPAAAPTAQIKVKEYDAFHEVLHPLEHEAVPAKDWQRIRTHANELVKRGKAIVKLGVPQGTAEKRLPEFRQELRKFNDALKQLDRYARKGTDTDVENSFASVHDSFEILLGMIP